MIEPANPGLAFERPIYELEAQLAEMDTSGDEVPSPETAEQVRNLRRELAGVTRDIYSKLTPWQTVQVARHKDRPQSADYVSSVFDEFVELHGDKYFGDDRALRTGFAKIDQYKVLFVGHFKGRNLDERGECYFGCAHPEGYRKAIAKMRLAAKYRLPIICLIDTPGAYPGVGAEERGQSLAIAQNMYEMSRLETPIICVVIGEGGSGGALGIGVGDRIAMLQNSYYSVISPEGCAGILWKSAKYAEDAAQALKFTSSYLKQFGIVDDVIEEPLGGAHRAPYQAAARLKMYLTQTLGELVDQPIDELLDARYKKFRRMGVFIDSSVEQDVTETA